MRSATPAVIKWQHDEVFVASNRSAIGVSKRVELGRGGVRRRPSPAFLRGRGAAIQRLRNPVRTVESSIAPAVLADVHGRLRPSPRPRWHARPTPCLHSTPGLSRIRT
jgi:hypothetical protein